MLTVIKGDEESQQFSSSASMLKATQQSTKSNALSGIGSCFTSILASALSLLFFETRNSCCVNDAIPCESMLVASLVFFEFSPFVRASALSYGGKISERLRVKRESLTGVEVHIGFACASSVRGVVV